MNNAYASQLTPFLTKQLVSVSANPIPTTLIIIGVVPAYTSALLEIHMMRNVCANQMMLTLMNRQEHVFVMVVITLLLKQHALFVATPL